jgi:hypothetical protein
VLVKRPTTYLGIPVSPPDYSGDKTTTIVDDLAKNFEDWLFGAVVAEVVEWVRRRRGGVVVRAGQVLEVVEIEGEEDEKVSTFEMQEPRNRERRCRREWEDGQPWRRAAPDRFAESLWIDGPQLAEHHDR